MAVSLSKGAKISLAKAAEDSGVSGALVNIGVGLGWDTNKYDGGFKFDLDASAFLLGADGKAPTDDNFVFYGHTSQTGVAHSGDNQDGAGEGDDETITVNLPNVPENIEKIAFTVTIHEAEKRNQNFGQVSNAYVRIYDMASGTEIIKYDLGEDFSIETAVVVGELYRHGGEWKFNAIGSGYQGGLAALCKDYGINAE